MKPRYMLITPSAPFRVPAEFFEDRHIAAGPRFEDSVYREGTLCTLKTPYGFWSLTELLNRIPKPLWPNVVLVHADSTMACTPIEIPAGISRVLLVGDTHHLERPIFRLLSYAAQVKFQAAIAWNRHCIHWFRQIGVPTFWLPSLIFGSPNVMTGGERHSSIAFFGQIGKLHPRRRAILDLIKAQDLPLVSGQMPLDQGLELFSKSLLAFNSSLNGELNMRVFEATSAGAALFTDRLAPQTGLELLFKDGESMICYDGHEDLVAKARHYLANPAQAVEIGRKGQEFYAAHLTNACRWAALNTLLSGGNPPELFSIANEPRCRMAPVKQENLGQLYDRIAFYEWVQEQHRVEEKVLVDVLGFPQPLHLTDIADLARADVARMADGEQAPAEWEGIIQVLAGRKLPVVDGPRKGAHMLLAEAAALSAAVAADPAYMDEYRAVFVTGAPDTATGVMEALLSAGFHSEKTSAGLFVKAAPETHS